MAYTPDPLDPTRPVGGDPASSIDEEFRALKQSINDRLQGKMGKGFNPEIAFPGGAANAPASGAFEVNLADASFFRVQLMGNTTFTFVHPELASNEIPFFTLRLVNAGNYTITWPTVIWEFSAPPLFVENSTDVLVFYKPYPTATFWEGKRALQQIGG